MTLTRRTGQQVMAEMSLRIRTISPVFVFRKNERDKEMLLSRTLMVGADREQFMEGMGGGGEMMNRVEQ